MRESIAKLFKYLLEQFGTITASYWSVLASNSFWGLSRGVVLLLEVFDYAFDSGDIATLVVAIA